MDCRKLLTEKMKENTMENDKMHPKLFEGSWNLLLINKISILFFRN